MHLEGKSEVKLLVEEGGPQHLPSDGLGHNVFVRAVDVKIDLADSLCGKVETVTLMGTHYRLGLKALRNILNSIFVGQSIWRSDVKSEC